MTDQPTKRAVPPWLYKLFTGHQYPYVRRLAKFATAHQARRRAPGADEGDDRGQVLGGLSSLFGQNPSGSQGGHDRGISRPGRVSCREGIRNSWRIPEEFLAKTYGKKKIKVNFYDGDNFVCTINFKVAGWTEHEQPDRF